MSDLVERLRNDGAMNLEMPAISHLRTTGALELEAAEAIDASHAAHVQAEGDLAAAIAEARRSLEREERIAVALRAERREVERLTGDLERMRREVREAKDRGDWRRITGAWIP
jgi:rubrerythrin